MTPSAYEKNVSKIFSPILTAAALSALLAGCSSAPVDTEDPDMIRSSSSSTSSSFTSSSVDSMVISSGSTMSSSVSEDVSVYKDGTYSAGGVYRSPAGGESVRISLTLEGNVITDATFEGDATHVKSMEMQSAFSSGFKEQVVGKSLDEVEVGVVNGSSLTGGGFMDAVAKIKLEAKA